ncbi:MAG: hypothetical protein KGL39_36080 [Patescibacteria group bacterium]|nr:hypothetical protein [Patescibacteria group bacterium]
MSVVIKCVKCSGVTEQRQQGNMDGSFSFGAWCPRCNKFVNDINAVVDPLAPDQTDEQRMIELLEAIDEKLQAQVDALLALNEKLTKLKK